MQISDLIEPYQRIDWNQTPVRERFNAVAQISLVLLEDYKAKIQLGYPDNVISEQYEPAIKFMVWLMGNIDYSDLLKATVKGIAIETAARFADDDELTRLRVVPNLRRTSGEFYAVAERALEIMDDVMAKHRPFDRFKRHIEIALYKTGSDHRDKITNGTFTVVGSRMTQDGAELLHPELTEKIGLNMHPKSAAKDDGELLGVIAHENIHAVEAMVAMFEKMNLSAENNSFTQRDLELAVARRAIGEWIHEQAFMYPVYHALPSERLARMGQGIVQNNFAALTQKKPHLAAVQATRP